MIPALENNRTLKSGVCAASTVQATLGYQLSMFRNDRDALTWSNPFFPVTSGASRGQLALAPDNQFHQVLGSAGYDITPTIRVSGDALLTIAFEILAHEATHESAGLDPRSPAPEAVSEATDVATAKE